MTMQEINNGLADEDALSVLINCEKYLPIGVKINTAEMLLDAIKGSALESSYSGDEPKLNMQVDLLSHILIRIAFIQMYSDVDLSDENESDCYEDYDLIMKNGIFEHVINEVGRTEFEEFESICNTVLESR